ncbi:MAG TPA: hypothetical protein VFV81_03105, partial [Verrucomicrobiae bacterium]|nr:hypothetical protein [Verrucomicrobiae bacterium]
VAFLSAALNLAPGITTTTNVMNTFWRDLNGATTVGLQGGGFFRPSLSADGRYLAYSATSISGSNAITVRNLISLTNVYTSPGVLLAMSASGGRIFYGWNNTLYAQDLSSQTNLLSMGISAASWSAGAWSDDGRYLAFLSTSNLAGGLDNTNKVYLKDFQTGSLTLIGLAGVCTNSAGAVLDGPAISGDGRFVVYPSMVTNTVAGSSASPPNLFLWDNHIGMFSLIVAGAPQPGAMAWMAAPAISDNGSTIDFLNFGLAPAGSALNRVVNADAFWVDSDGDGIPDWWMLEYFGHADAEAGDLSRPTDDADGDGMSNFEEYEAGTSPVDAGSLFQVRSAVPVIQQLTLTWPASANRSYAVEYKTNLTDTVWLPAPGNVSVNGSEGTYTVPATDGQGFYRVLVSF